MLRVKEIFDYVSDCLYANYCDLVMKGEQMLLRITELNLRFSEEVKRFLSFDRSSNHSSRFLKEFRLSLICSLSSPRIRTLLMKLQSTIRFNSSESVTTSDDYVIV